MSAPVRTWPIIMEPRMVRSLLEGRKIQTRRIPNPMWANVEAAHQAGHRVLLWVREMHALAGTCCTFHADFFSLYGGGPKWRPSIHLPRQYSRLTLEVESIGLERLHQITDEAIAAEGGEDVYGRTGDVVAFRALWDELHPERGRRWDDNPRVYAIAFKVHQANVDALGAATAAPAARATVLEFPRHA